MADAPAGGGGGGWGAVEVIFALVLAVGLISTFTGNPIPSNGIASKVTAPHSKNTTPSCGIIIDTPHAKDKIDTSVTVNGRYVECLNAAPVPDTLLLHVVDATGASLSDTLTVNVSHSFFGDSSFNGYIPLVGTAHSVTAYVVVTSPAYRTTAAQSVRVAIQLLTSDVSSAHSTTTINTTTSNSSATSSNTGSYFVPSSTSPTTTTQTYTAPAPSYNPAPSNSNNTAPSSTPSGSGSNTF